MTVLASCMALFAHAGEANAVESVAESMTIAFFMPHLNTPFMNNLGEAVKKYAEAAGVKLVEYVADNDPSKQVSQIGDAVALGVDGILLDPSSNEDIAEGVRGAKAAGIPVVTLHEPVSTQNECVSFVGPDFTDGGVKQMRQAMADFPRGGNFAVIYGMMGHSAQINISAGYPIALKGYENKYKIVFEGEGEWSTESALALAAQWFSSGERIDAVICNNDAMAIGALQAATNAGRAGKVRIYGLDAQDDVLGAIEEGLIHATVFTDYETEARVSIDIIVKVVKGEYINSRYMIPMTLITEKNVGRFIKK
ncbi:MAG: sugar ABC transporter substrate-binding protein [Synergistaceae bacterium]|nr:sugar ABC transporter substrate-binding protein [Synergistaceae bacterium]